MAKFSFKDTIGYKYYSVAFGNFIVERQINKRILIVKLLDAPTFSGCYGKGYATMHVTSKSLLNKIPYFDESLNITNILKMHLTLEE